jgi:hypothetical protein
LRVYPASYQRDLSPGPVVSALDLEVVVRVELGKLVVTERLILASADDTIT